MQILLHIPAQNCTVLTFQLNNRLYILFLSLFYHIFDILLSILYLVYASDLQYLLSSFLIFYMFIVMHQHIKPYSLYVKTFSPIKTDSDSDSDLLTDGVAMQFCLITLF